MEPKTREFNATAAAVLEDPKIQANLAGLYGGFHQARLDAAEATPGWDALKDHARAIKAHTIEHLDYYLEMLERNVARPAARSSSPKTLQPRTATSSTSPGAAESSSPSRASPWSPRRWASTIA